MYEKKGWIPENVVNEVRNIDLLTYLERYEPFELVAVSPGVYSTRTHDSLKISNGKWFRWSQGVGGTSALDFLVRVRNMDFYSAVKVLYQKAALDSINDFRKENVANNVQYERKNNESIPFILPKPHINNDRVIQYLTRRCIHPNIISDCIERGLLYEDDRHHNSIFVGFNEAGEPKYAYKRATWDAEKGKRSFMGEAGGSKKKFAFALSATKESRELIVTEAPIDALSVASLMQMRGKDWRNVHILALGGVAASRDLPVALAQYLDAHEEISCISLCLDNDEVGQNAAETIMERLKYRPQKYHLQNAPPIKGKDYNDYLQMKCRSQKRAAFSR